MHDSTNRLERLRETLARPDTVLLIGSGVSLWSGLPTWPALLSELADFVDKLGRDAAPIREEIKNGDLLLAAGYAVHQLDLREFGLFVRSATRHGRAKPAEIHRLIAKLGPSCFITTNYDRLLETALVDTGTHATISIVTNRQVTEIADILPSYARQFVFKYHGDVEDAASIVLTRDQYRSIQHDYPATTRALGTLLATRPIVMIGFGLRDLDFLAIKDELVSAFEGQAGEYFAIMPDFDRLRTEYWRKTYRTEVVSYETAMTSDGISDHTHLIALLRQLQPSAGSGVGPPSRSPDRSGYSALLFVRLAASILRKRISLSGDILPLTVTAGRNSKGHYPIHSSQLSHLLLNYDGSFLLIGLPGAGKTFALANFAVELAASLLNQCIEENVEPTLFRIPVLLNLAIYMGDLKQLIQDALPTGLTVASLLHDYRCTLILDGANEVPREFIENERWLTDFRELLSASPRCQYIIGSRNEGWLTSLDLPRFTISDINKDYVRTRFSSVSSISMDTNPELVSTLCKPLFFSLAEKRRIDLESVRTPNDVYSNFFAHIDKGWQAQSASTVSFASAFESTAFSMLEAGSEVGPKQIFENALRSTRLSPNAAEEAISYLLAQGALVAHTGHRLSFFHQSITEYLAARVIAYQFIRSSKTLLQRLADKRWDQALFLAMSFLDNSTRSKFFDTILTTDLAAAARAAHYVEGDQSRLINEILKKASNRAARAERSKIEDYHQIAYQLERLPFTVGNVRSLERVFRLRDSVGGVGAGALFLLKPATRKRLIGEIFKRHNDWNYLQTFIHMTAGFWREDDLSNLLAALRGKKIDKEKNFSRFGQLLAERVPFHTLIRWSQRYLGEKNMASIALMDALSDIDAPEARRLLFERLREGDKNAIYLLYSNLEFHAENATSDELTPDSKVASFLARMLASPDAEWVFELGRKFVERDREWGELFRGVAKKDIGLDLVLQSMIGTSSAADVMVRAITEIDKIDGKYLRVLAHDEFWKAAPDNLVLKALAVRNPLFAEPLLEQLQGRELPLLNGNPLDWWLDWIEECLQSKDQTTFWCGYMLSQALRDADPSTSRALLARFNENPIDFERIGRAVFRFGGLSFSSDQLSEGARDRLLRGGARYSFSAEVLGGTATEDFARRVLFPCFAANRKNLWLRAALEIAGRRHNRRYLIGADVA